MRSEQDEPVYWTSYAYADETIAEQVFLALQKLGERHKGKLELGFYRHGSESSGMICRSRKHRSGRSGFRRHRRTSLNRSQQPEKPRPLSRR